MIRLGSAILLVAMLLTGTRSPAAAGQTDPRLSTLFGQLQSTTDRNVARGLESEIWRLWTDAGSVPANRLMTAGIRAMNSGELDAALGLFNELVGIRPNFAEGWNKRATVFYLMTSYGASMRDIARTLELEPRHFGALSGLGLINQAVGRLELAIRAFEKALEIHPHLPELRDKIREMKKNLRGKNI